MSAKAPQVSAQDLAYALPGAFANYASMGAWRYARHLKLIEDNILPILDGEELRLMVSIAPRSGKSFLISTYFPAWYLGRFPDRQVMLLSHQQKFAQKFGRRARNAFRAYAPEIFGVSLSDDAQATEAWETTQGGGMYSIGAGGSILGKGTHMLIIDDIIKGKAEALNAKYLDDLWEWFTTDVLSRLEPGASIIILNTRWAVKDLIGRLRHWSASSPEADRWKEIIIPALAEENDPLGRKPGEALWPERYPRERLLRLKNSGMSSFWWNCMYMQRPVPREGNLVNINWFRRFRVIPSEKEREMTIFSFDTASKDREINDFTVIQVWLVKEGFYYLVHQVRERMQFPKLLKTATEMQGIWRPNVMLVEDKGSGTSLIQALRELSAPVIAINPIASKLVRFDAETPAIQGGQVFLPDETLQTPWLSDFEDEIRAFPDVQFDDQGDAMSQLLAWLRLKRKLSDFDVW